MTGLARSTDNATERSPAPGGRGREIAAPRNPAASRTAMLLNLQRLAGNAAVVGMMSTPSVQRSPGEIDDRGLLLVVRSADATCAWEFELSELSASTVASLRASPQAIAEVEAAIQAALTDDAGPRHESSAYLESPAVANELRRDVDEWPAKRTLTRFTNRLNGRATALRNTKLRYQLEQALESSRLARPGEIGWRREVVALRGHPPVKGNNVFDAAKEDRFELVLNILDREAGSDPDPGGPLHTVGLAKLIWDRYCSTDGVPSELSGEEMMRTHSNAFLLDWLPKITGAKFVPDGFDLEPFRPKDRMDSVRKGLVAKFIRDAAPQSMEWFLLNRWAGAPAASPDQFMKTADIDGLRGDLLDHLTKDFMKWAPSQPGWRGAFWSDVAQRAAFGAMTTLVFSARGLQQFHAGLANKFAATKLEHLSNEEYGIAKDPHGYAQGVTNAAKTSHGLLSGMRPGAPLEANLSKWYDAVASAWSPGTDEATPAAGLHALFQALGAVKTTIEEQKEATKEQIGKGLDTSYARISAIVKSEARVAEQFIKNKWIPMLKTVALEQVTKNRDDMKVALTNWDKYRVESAAKFRVCGHLLNEMIEKLESGKVESISLDGQELTRAHVDQLKTAREFMLGQADAMADPGKAADKKDDMEEAVEGFEKVLENIKSGEYEPIDYTKSVYDEARRRLGIAGYESWVTTNMALSRWAVVPQNPFIGYVIARWQWEEHVKRLDKQFALFIALGLLTVASLVVPGTTGLVLAGIDIAVSIGTGIAHVDDAYDLLALARLDPDGKVRGVTVEMAEKALTTAWIGLGLTVVLTAGIGVLWARLLLKGQGGARVPAELTRVNALMRVNPQAAEKLIAKVKDMEKLEKLLETTGDSLLLERMLAKSPEVRHLEYVLMHGDPRKIAELVDKAGDAAVLGKILDHVSDTAVAEKLLKLSDNGGELAILVEKTSNPMIAETLLKWAPTNAEANRLAILAKNADELAILSKHYKPDVAEQLLGQANDAAQLNRLVPRMDTGPIQLRSLLETRTATEVETLLNKGARASDIPMGIGKPGIGAQPTFAISRQPPPPATKAALEKVGLGDHTRLDQVSDHEAARIVKVLETNNFPKRAGETINKQVAKWAADGAKDPIDFTHRWEYARTRYGDIKDGIKPADLPRGKSLDSVAGAKLADELGTGALATRLAEEEKVAAKLAGAGWLEVGTADSVKGAATRIGFGSETTTVYHVNKHFDELPLAIQQSAGTSVEARTSAYMGDARRTIMDGNMTSQPGDGITNLVFTRSVPEGGGTRVMTTRVVFRDGWALISSHQGNVL
jgi:hypothetical protein